MVTDFTFLLQSIAWPVVLLLAWLLAERAQLILDNKLTKLAHDPADEWPVSASQAIDYLHAHAHTAVTMQQLTQTLGTPGRTLHQGFVETFGTTPMAYLRTLRLSNARHDLLTQRWATVTETAMQWNFFHLGRFSQDYQRIYGETPSQTFRRNST